MMASSFPAMDKPDRADFGSTESSRVTRQLNLRLLVGTLLAVAVLGPAAYFWREYQVKRTAGSFLSLADSLEKEEKWGEASSHLFRYLQLRPDDADARIRLADTFAKSAAHDARLRSQAVKLYRRALGVASEERKSALRSSLAELLLNSREFGAAESEAKQLLAENPDDPLGLRILALSHFAMHSQSGQNAKSEDGMLIGREFENALAREPGNIILNCSLAQIYRTDFLLLSKEQQELSASEREKLADDVMDRMLAANSEDARAYLARYRYRTIYNLEGSREDLEVALKLAPDDLGGLLLAAIEARQEARRVLSEGGSAEDAEEASEEHLVVACDYYNRIISEIAPQDERAYVGLGEVLELRGKVDEAIEVWRKGLATTNANSIALNLCLAEALLSQKRIEPAEKAVNAFSSAVDARLPSLPRPARLSLRRLVSMLRGRCFAMKGEFHQAIVQLKRVLASRPISDIEVLQTLQTEMLLGDIYSSMSEWDLAAAAFERAARLQPSLTAPRIALANVLVRFKPASAISHYEAALTMGDPTSNANSRGLDVTSVERAEAWLALARANFQKQMRLPEGDRDWGPYQKSIGEAKSSVNITALPDAWRVDALEADHLALIGEEKGDRQQGLRDAVEHLRQAEKKYPDSEGFFLSLVSSYERFGAPEDSERVLDTLEDLTGESSATYVLRSNLFLSRGEHDKAREILQKGLKVLPSGDHPTLNGALVRVDLNSGDVEASQGQLLALHKKEPTNLGLIRQLLELAFERNDMQSAEKWERKFRDLVGPGSAYADYSKIRRLLAGAKDKLDPAFVEGLKLLAEVEKRLPNSSRVRFLRGMVLQMQGDRRGAIRGYQDTIRLGMHTVSVYERLIATLEAERRFDEARAYLAKAKERKISSQMLLALEIEIAASEKDLDRAEKLAQDAVAENPESISAKLNYGRMLVANKKTEEAKVVFQEAIRHAPTDFRTYGEFFNFYLQTEHNDLARGMLEELEKNADLPPVELAFVLAQRYEQLGDIEKADVHYREAQQLDPENAVQQVQLVNFLIRNDKTDEAEAILRDILQSDPRADNARRQLVEILVNRGGEKEWQEALDLLTQSGSDESVSNLDRRLQAFLLLRRAGSENLEKARSLLEGLVLDKQDPADADRLLLAQVYEKGITPLRGVGDETGAENLFRDAREQYTAVVNRADPDPSHLSLFVQFLIRNGETGAASGYLDRLERLTTDNLNTMQLRVRWLHGESRTEEIEALVEGLAEKISKEVQETPSAQAQLALSIGELYSSVELHQEAEGWYRRLVELDPTAYARLVSALAQQDRIQDAIDVCLKAAEPDKSTRPARVLAMMLVTEKVGEEELQRAEPVLKGAIEDHPDDPALLRSLADLSVYRKELDEANRLYQRAVELDPKNIIALNNWATLLSELPGKGKEAIEVIERAIGLAGEQAALLDTKGMILVQGGNHKQAVPFLEAAAFSANPDPRYHFHLAVAHMYNGDLDKARESLEEANRGNLNDWFLTESDLRFLTELQEKLRD